MINRLNFHFPALIRNKHGDKRTIKLKKNWTLMLKKSIQQTSFNNDSFFELTIFSKLIREKSVGMKIVNLFSEFLRSSKTSVDFNAL